MKLELCPVTLREARAFVAQHHRHHPPPQGGLFAVGVAVGETMVGVAIVGKPVARMVARLPYVAEITRLAVLPHFFNACSMLYGACWRVARAMGYRRLITYILNTEHGASAKAAGFRVVAETKGGSWDRKSRPRVDLHPTQGKLRLERTA